MLKAYSRIFCVLFMLLSTTLYAKETKSISEDIPQALTPWLPWVMDGNEVYNCPFINRTDFSKKKNHICAWPSTLILDVTDEGATFQQSWQVLEQSYIPLPGSSQNWPLSVKVNNKLLPVTLFQGQPAIALEKGIYKVTGQFIWPTIPESINVPRQYAFVNMSINGQTIAFPKIEDNDLWLQELEPSQAQHDSIAVTVARRVTDGSHIALDTYLDFNVSGKMREVIVGRALPENIELIGIDSELPAFLDADGLLHVKLKPGNWQMLIRGYAKQTLLTWQKPIQSHHWPKEEVWVFKGDESLRIGKLSGGQMIDSNQADMPNAWYTLPSYLLKEGDALRYDIQHRGKPVHIENQLTLNRTLWLSFDGENYTFNDNIRGQMINDWRLSMKLPYLLESAEDQDGSVLITSKGDGERGIENRYPGTNIKARGVFQSDSEIAISGWQSNFERVSLRLNLPPGNKLFAVFGADSVSNSWWSNWTIWASFIVLLSAFVASRIVSVSAGVVTALMLVAIYQESGVPLFAIVNFLLAIAVKTHQPFTSLKAIVNGYWACSVALVVGTILYFSAMQLRTVIHPQLESNVTKVQSFNDRSNAEMSIVTDMVKSRSEKQAFSAQQDVERIEVTGSRIKKADLLMERYQSDAMIQAGSGIPDWQWQPYTINWHSPVTQGQIFDVLVLSKNSYRVLKVLGVLLALLWLVLVLKDNIKLKINKLSSPALVSLLALGLLLPGYSGKVAAANFPPQALLDELQQRVLSAPKCAPSCALINQIKVQSQASQLTIILDVHANAETAIALPKSEFWRPEKLFLNAKPVQSLFKQGRWLYIPVAQGISTFSLSGEIAPVDTFQLEFKDKPQHVELGLNNAWQVVGVQANHLTGNTLAFLSLANEQALNNSDTAKESNASSTRYAYQPFVKVVRELSIDQIWTVTTTVKRIAPSSGSINMQVPTLPGERIISADMVVENAQVNVTLPAGENEFRWNSTIERQALLSLQASATLPVVEQWQIIVNPSWHADISGIPMILGAQEPDDYYSYLFYPYPGETLTIATSRPNAVKGEILAIDSVNVEIEQGTRTSKLNLSFDYRSTRGGEHHIELPDSYQLKEIRTDNKLINLQLEQGKLALPILPGKHTIQISMRSNTSNELMLTVPTINLNAPVSNITSNVNLTRQRWVLWTDGPILGPAVLYWGELLAFILLAILVARVPFSPLTLMSWIALGVGLSLNNWGILILVAVWFASLTASTYRPKNLNRLAFNFSQFILYGLSIVTILALVAVIPTSLLSSPNMGVTGNYSFGNNLQWFADKSDGLLPDITVFSIPVLFYKGLMLAWVIWLSFTSLSWIKWAWGKLGAQGYWRAKQQVVTKTPTNKEHE